MAEGQVSVDGAPRPLPEPFMVLATQNPHEHAGTYPLPESQLDRFLLRVSLGYPSAEVERDLLLGGGTQGELAHLHPAATAQEVRRLRSAVPAVAVAPEIADYVLAIVAASWRAAGFARRLAARGDRAFGGRARTGASCAGAATWSRRREKGCASRCWPTRIVLAGRGPGGGRPSLSRGRAGGPRSGRAGAGAR
jgi:MoxR-like ATPase